MFEFRNIFYSFSKMKVAKGELYQLLYAAYRKAYPEKSGIATQNAINSLWAELKEKVKHENSEDLSTLVENKILSLKRLSTSKKTNSFLLKYFTSKNTGEQAEGIEKNINKTAVTSVKSIIPNVVAEPDCIVATGDDENEENLDEIEEKNSNSVNRIPKKPAQELLGRNIRILEKKIMDITQARDAGLNTDSDAKELKKLRASLL